MSGNAMTSISNNTYYNNRVGDAAQPAPAHTIVGQTGRITSYVGQLAEMIQRAEGLADRLGGSHPVPAEISKATPKPVPNGAVDELRDVADTFSAALNRLECALNRINDAL